MLPQCLQPRPALRPRSSQVPTSEQGLRPRHLCPRPTTPKERARLLCHGAAEQRELKGDGKQKRGAKYVRRRLSSQKEQVRQRRELRGSRTGQETETIFLVSLCKTATPAPTPTPASLETPECGSAAADVSEAGWCGTRPGLLGPAARRRSLWREFPAASLLLPLGPVLQTSSRVSAPALPPSSSPPPIYLLSKTIKKRSTPLTSRSPFQ